MYNKYNLLKKMISKFKILIILSFLVSTISTKIVWNTKCEPKCPNSCNLYDSYLNYLI